MAETIFVESPAGMYQLAKSWDGPVGRHITLKTNDVGFFARAYAPKPGGIGHGRTKINYATGRTAAGIRTSRSRSAQGELEGHVVAIPKHAIWVHEGTRPHVIKPKVAPALVFFWAKAGGTVRLQKVHHPGTPADPFLAKGLKRVFRGV